MIVRFLLREEDYLGLGLSKYFILYINSIRPFFSSTSTEQKKYRITLCRYCVHLTQWETNSKQKGTQASRNFQPHKHENISDDYQWPQIHWYLSSHTNPYCSRGTSIHEWNVGTRWFQISFVLLMCLRTRVPWNLCIIWNISLYSSPSI